MSGDPAKLITISWQVLRDDGPDAFVLEFTDGQLVLTFGPMPKGIVNDFLAKRKRALEDLFDRIIGKLNNGQDPPQEHQQVPDQTVS